MSEEMARMISRMTFEELTQFSGELLDDYNNIVSDGQGLTHYSIAECLIGSANLVLSEVSDD